MTIPDQGDGATLLHEVYDFLGQYIIYPSKAAHVAHTLWIAHTHLMQLWDSTPRIYFKSPEASSGKTRALEVTEYLVPRPIHSVNVTPAYLFRKISDPEGLPTILYDEIDTVFGPKAKEHEDIRAVINSGHRKGATAGRCVGVGTNMKTEEFPSYCAVAMAGIGDLPDTIMTRCIVVSMKKRKGTEYVKPWRLRIDAPMAEGLGLRLSYWAQGVIAQQESDPFKWPEMPQDIQDRDADMWEPLLVIADLVGADWPGKAREAACSVVAQKTDENATEGVLLLKDIQEIFYSKGLDKVATAELLTELCRIDESPWRSIGRGETPLNPRGLAQLLKPYGIKSHNVRPKPDQVSKGYERADFEDAWERYLPTSATSGETLPKMLLDRQTSELLDKAGHTHTHKTQETIHSTVAGEGQQKRERGGAPALKTSATSATTLQPQVDNGEVCSGLGCVADRATLRHKLSKSSKNGKGR